MVVLLPPALTGRAGRDARKAMPIDAGFSTRGRTLGPDVAQKDTVLGKRDTAGCDGAEGGWDALP